MRRWLDPVDAVSMAGDALTGWSLLLAFAVAVVAAPPYWISGPESYLVLSGDIDVHYRIPASAPILRVQLVEIVAGKERPLVKKDVPRNSTSGKILFPCGLVEKAGQIAFRLVTVDEDKVLARTDATDVQWPLVTVHVPLLVETYSSNVVVQLYLESLRCSPRHKGTYATYVDLLYEGSSLPQPKEEISSWHEPTVLLSKELIGWLLQTAYDVTLDCEYFDRAGYYRVQIRTTVQTAPMIAKSDIIHVLWSHRYSVSVPKPAVEPCHDTLSVIYHYPRCTLDQDRIRVYGKASRNSPLKYLVESRVKNKRHSSKLACDVFGEEYQEFCFTFVSTARNGAVFEIESHCIPRAFDPGGSVPMWSEWSTWSQCSGTCGSGVHSRYRLCSSSKSSADCEGKSVETQICSNELCPELSTSGIEESPYLSSECLCGCMINVTDRTVVRPTFINCHPPVVWVVQAWPSGYLTAEFLQVKLPLPDPWLTVRDGGSSVGSILAVLSGDGAPNAVHSVSAVMRLEIQVSNITLLEEIGFKVVLTRSEGPRESLPIVQQLSRARRSSLSAVHVTIILLATVLGSTTALMLLLHHFRCLQRRKLGSIRSASPCSVVHPEGESCPSQHLLAATTSTSELSGSPLVERRNKRIKSSPPSYSPEDFLHNSFLFRSASSLCTTGTPPLSRRPSFAAAVAPSNRRDLFGRNTQTPVATVSPQPKPKWDKSVEMPKRPLKSALKQRPSDMSSNSSVAKGSDVMSPVRRRGKPPGRAARQVQRESAAPLTASVSELSITGSEDGFEYDYYDYGCHDVPGSFFCTDPMLLGWPPFIPLPPQGSDDFIDFPLQHFTPSPTHSQSEQELQSTKS